MPSSVRRAAFCLCAALGSLPLANLTAQEPATPQSALAIERLVADSIQRAEKSVVAIARVRRETGSLPTTDDSDAPLLPGLAAEEPTDPSFVPSDFGSGVAIDSRGLILTNYHVLGDLKSSDFYVWHARKPYLAKVKAADAWLDLAVLEVSAQDLQPITFSHETVRKGQFVIALGNPYAIARDGQPSASWGIVSNVERQAPLPASASRGGAERRETLHHWGTLIQTDARLELGSSGGALVNLKGELVGITTAYAALAGFERPGGFAIPINDTFHQAIESLKRGQLPDYGFLGVAPSTLTAAERRLGRFGVAVDDIVPATPAASAGLKAGDTITHFDGEPVRDDLELIRHVSGRLAGATAVLSVEREGRSRQIPITLSKKPTGGGRASYAEAVPPAWRGLRVDYATAAPLFREQSRDLDPAGCVGVVEVARESAAWTAGLRPGDFISHVFDARVTNPQQFFAAVAPLEGDVSLRLTAAPDSKSLRTVPDVP